MPVRVLASPHPIDLRLTLGLTRHGRSDPATRFPGPGELWRATRNADGPVTLRLKERGGRVAAEAWGPGAGLALDRLPDLIGANDDLDGFVAHHRLVARLAHDLPGLRLCRTGALVEALVPTILEQKVTTFEAHRAYQQLMRRYGEPAPGPGGLVLPPAPSVLAGAPYYDLHVLGIERKRADTIRRVCARATRLEQLADSAPADARDHLTTITGIGPWSAASVTLVSHGDPDAVIVGDYHLPRMVNLALAGEHLDDDDRMLELLEPYRGHRARVQRLIMMAGIGRKRRTPRARIRSIASI
jgi:3-methyladenine DNA glycosylase/8-oxoguanine DNA glycosylase